MRCSVCQSSLHAGHRYCSRCGAHIDGWACEFCGERNDRQVTACAKCGRNLNGSTAAALHAHRVVDADFQPERQFLTILSVDIRSSTHLIADLDSEDAIARLAPALDGMRLAVHEHGGIVSEELGDGLLALFGAPKADDNHAIRACLSALSLMKRIAGLGDPSLQVRVGLHSGYAVTRYKRADLTTVYGAGGPAVHLASRLQSAARPGTTLASKSCRELASGYVSMRALPPVHSNGFSEDIAGP